jgi:hypothetical protein
VKIFSTNDPVADWKAVSFGDDPTSDRGYRIAIHSYDNSTYFSSISSVANYLENNNHIFGGWPVPTDGLVYRLASGNMNGSASNVLRVKRMFDEDLQEFYWQVTSGFRPLSDSDVMWIKYGHNAGRWIGCNFVSGAFRWEFVGEPTQQKTSNVTNWQIIDAGKPLAEVRGIEWMVSVVRGGTTEQYLCSGAWNGNVARLHGPFDAQRIGLDAIPGLELRAAIHAQRLVLQARTDAPAHFHVTQVGFTRA